MRIAILGIRGVPANYGGFETFAEQIGARLVERGHEVTVYGRDRYIPRVPPEASRDARRATSGPALEVP